MASVVSRNPFDLLGESADPETVVKETEPTTKEPVVVQKKVDRSRASPKEARIRHEYPQRGGHKPSASNRNNEDTRSGAPRDRNVGPRLSGRREEGGGGGGGGDYHSTRPSRGARPNDRGRGSRGGGRRGREHDRHSGTGRYDSEKKDNQGWGKQAEPWNNNGTTETTWNTESNDNANVSSSWGDNANDTNTGSWGDKNTTNTAEENNGWNAGVGEESSATNDAWNATDDTGNSSWEQQPEPAIVDEGAKNEDTAAGDSAPAPEPDPEETHKTLDEYLAEKAQKSLDISLPEVRKANEGVDDSQWKDAVPLEKGEDDDFLFAGKEQSYRLKNKKTKAKNIVDITQTFEKHGGGPTRGRGRGRGRGGNRGERDGRDRRDNNYRDRDNNYEDNRRRGGGGGGRSVVNLDDQMAFPSLGASS